MAIITKDKAPSSHWYTPDGFPIHQMDTAKGGKRPTDLRDARKFGLFPSVTGIIGIFAKPQLETWKLKQVALSAIKNPKDEKESDDYYVKRIIEAAFDQVDKAADFGTLCHFAIEEYIKFGKPIPEDLKVYLDPVIVLLESSKMKVSASEATVVNKNFGFAGAMDFSFTWGNGKVGVLDFKTRKTKPNVAVEAYDYQDMQIAAYGSTYWSLKLGISEMEALSLCLGANIFISSTEPGRIEIVKYTPEQLMAVFPTFCNACEMWRYIKKYDPRVAVPTIIETTKEILKIEPSDQPQDLELEQTCKACHGKKKNTKGKPCVCTKAQTPAENIKAKEDTKEDTKESKVTINFGKHKGKSLDQIPVEYLEWITSQKKHREDADLMSAIELILRSK